MIVTSCASIKARPVHYLVPGRIALGKVTLVAARGGSGKSTLFRSLAARVSRGEPAFGMGYESQPAKTLIFAAEDGPEDTIVPGLIAEGADLNRIAIVDGVRHDGKTHAFTLLPEHIDLLRARLEASPDISLVIIDPIATYVGRTRINDHKAAELRLVLDPLNALAAETGAAIVIIAHVNKANGDAVDRIAGSAAYIVAPDPEDDTQRLLMPVKWNLLGFDRTSIPFRLNPLSDTAAAAVLREPQFADLNDDDRAAMRYQLGRLAFDACRAVNADDAMKQKEGSSQNKVQKCADFIKEYLGAFAHPSKEILSAAQGNGFTFDNVKKAKLALKEAGLRHSNLGQLQGEWWSGFGPVESWTLRPVSTQLSQPFQLSP